MYSYQYQIYLRELCPDHCSVKLDLIEQCPPSASSPSRPLSSRASSITPAYALLSHPLLSPADTTSPGRLEHPLVDSLPLRRRFRHPRSRVVHRLRILHPRHLLRPLLDLEHSRKRKARFVLSEFVGRALGGRCAGGWAEFCVDMDTVLRVGESLSWKGVLAEDSRRSARRGEKRTWKGVLRQKARLNQADGRQ